MYYSLIIQVCKYQVSIANGPSFNIMSYFEFSLCMCILSSNSPSGSGHWPPLPLGQNMFAYYFKLSFIKISIVHACYVTAATKFYVVISYRSYDCAEIAHKYGWYEYGVHKVKHMNCEPGKYL